MALALTLSPNSTTATKLLPDVPYHFLVPSRAREPYDAWEEDGSRSALDRAKERVRQALAKHQPRELDPSMEQEPEKMRQMIAERPLDDFYLYEMENRQDWDNL